MAHLDEQLPFADFAGFGIAGYRSFGRGVVELVGPMSKVHLVVGQNNVGKSNILTFAHAALQRTAQRSAQKFPSERLDIPEGKSADSGRGMSIGLYLTEAVRAALGTQDVIDLLAPLLATQTFSRGEDGVLWLDFDRVGETNNGRDMRPDQGQLTRGLEELEREGLSQPDMGLLANAISGRSGGTDTLNWQYIVDTWNPWQFVPPTDFIAGLREIRREVQETDALAYQVQKSGLGLIEALAKIQHPEHGQYAADRAKFDKLNTFIANVLEDPSARIEIPVSNKTVHVHTRKGVLPIDNLGTGISEVVILAALASVGDPTLMCIEEPEVHLHPTLQRKLVSYLQTSTENRYLISTHSASLLNAGIGSISHVTQPAQWSEVQAISTPGGLAATAFDLGNKASDIVQSNFVVWVEGPSDRVYVLHWLAMADPSLVEGANFSVMFYGGGLLNHLSVGDGETDDLIALLAINRNCAILIDSDIKSADAKLNATKVRVLEEVEAYPNAVSWVTTGYTIENYIPKPVLGAALTLTYPDMKYTIPKGRWRSPLGSTFVERKTKPSKVMIARAVVQGGIPLSDWPLHVREKTDELVTAIRRSNHLS